MKVKKLLQYLRIGIVFNDTIKEFNNFLKEIKNIGFKPTLEYIKNVDEIKDFRRVDFVIHCAYRQRYTIRGWNDFIELPENAEKISSDIPEQVRTTEEALKYLQMIYNYLRSRYERN